MAGSSSSYITELVDDFYFSLLFDEEQLFPISDENYADQIQLQEVLMSSTISSLHNSPPSETENHISENQKISVEKERGQSSQCFCTICMDYKATEEMFTNTTCTHSFCKECISKYVASKVQENIIKVDCPDTNCSRGIIGPDICGEIVPREVLERWENALCESLIVGSQKCYCPFKDCSALMVDDGGETVTASECPYCWRLFCAQCKVPWHAGMDCSQFKSLKEDERENEDIMLMELAKNRKWRRCPKCKFFVDKIDGCLHITCRCGYEFCYGCGSDYTSTHAC